eukprot:scaffold48_cov311-Pinguiococcus_pyrenoidosus.AAC.4
MAASGETGRCSEGKEQRKKRRLCAAAAAASGPSAARARLDPNARQWSGDRALALRRLHGLQR